MLSAIALANIIKSTGTALPTVPAHPQTFPMTIAIGGRAKQPACSDPDPMHPTRARTRANNAHPRQRVSLMAPPDASQPAKLDTKKGTEEVN